MKNIVYIVMLIIGVYIISPTYEYKSEPIIYEEPIIIEQENIQENIQEKKNYYEITDYERDLIAKLLWTEARGESLECQKAVVSVIFNRLDSGYWGNSIEGVIKAPGQFDLGNKLNNVKPTETQYEIVDYIVENGPTLPKDVIYFRAYYYHSWATNYCQIDHTYFSKR